MSTARINGRKIVRSAKHDGRELFACRRWSKLYWTANLGDSWHPTKAEACSAQVRHTFNTLPGDYVVTAESEHGEYKPGDALSVDAKHVHNFTVGGSMTIAEFEQCQGVEYAPR